MCQTIKSLFPSLMYRNFSLLMERPFWRLMPKGRDFGRKCWGDALLILWGKGEANKISHLLGVCKDRFHFGISTKDLS